MPIAEKPFNMQNNLRYSCAMLAHVYRHGKSNLYLALRRYNGSRGCPEYPNAVLAALETLEIQG